MGWRHWKKWQITLGMVALSIPVLIYIGQSKPTADCVHADKAMRHYAGVLPDIMAALATDSDTAKLSQDTAAAAAQIRSTADQIKDSTLQAKVDRLAADVELISGSSPGSGPNKFPDKDYMSGYQDATTVLHDLKVACPQAGD